MQCRADVPAAHHQPGAGHLGSCPEHPDGPPGPPARRNHQTSSRIYLGPVPVSLACLIPVLSQDATTSCSGKEVLAKLYQGSQCWGKTHLSGAWHSTLHNASGFLRCLRNPHQFLSPLQNFLLNSTFCVFHCPALPSKDQRIKGNYAAASLVCYKIRIPGF